MPKPDRACQDCARALVDVANWNRFNPGCLNCGGRYIWFVQKRVRASEERKRELLQDIVRDWTAIGHDEQRLRELGAENWRTFIHDLHRH